MTTARPAAASGDGIGPDPEACRRAVVSGDHRFDGQFVVTVSSTGIYCRPSCPAIRPRWENLGFVRTTAAAQQRGFRACRRCLPDEAPGAPRQDIGDDLASRAMRLIRDGVVERAGVDGLAAALGHSPGQLTRVMTEHLGAGPDALARAQRATTARLLLHHTRMPVSDIAIAAGFADVRQFDDTVHEVFGETPTALRRRGSDAAPSSTGSDWSTIRLRLPVRQPLSLAWLDWFLAGHAVAGLEHHDGTTFHRAFAGPRAPVLTSTTVQTDHVDAVVRAGDPRDLGPAIERLRRLLDLDADPSSIDETLAGDPDIGPLVTAWPGIRVLGSVDAFETLIRTMVGQQISLAAARTHVGRLVTTLGEQLDGPAGAAVSRLFPTPEALAERGHEVLRGPRRRVAAICGVARAVAEGAITLHPGMERAELRESLLAQPGVGRWTADYVVMRVLHDPDVLLDSDLVLRRHADALGVDLTDAARWSPWRSYVSMHLWRDALAPTVPLLRPGPDPAAAPDGTDAARAASD